MAKRRTAGIQRRDRASTEAMNRRIDQPQGSVLPDWRILAIGGVLLVGSIIVVLVLVFGSAASPTAGAAQPNDGSVHTEDGAACRENPASCGASGPPYSSLPGTSGPHWISPGSWGVYTTPVSESQVIHNLEHGGIVIWYDPERVDDASVQALTDYVETQVASGVSGRYKFILSPWGGSDPLPAPIVATAWRYLLELDTADTAAIDEFARAHYGRSPEPNGGPGPPGG
ncbi:MAG TPA: DUF3105 domain-containing protein [Candidatus Limnocylindria bacterium]|jgi:hypothetical protein